MAKDSHSSEMQHNPDDDDQSGPPLSFVVLKTSVYLMGVMLIVGFAFLIYALVDRASQTGRTADADSLETRLPLLEGEQIGALAIDRNTLAVQVKGAGGEESIVVFDLAANRILRRVRIERGAGN